MQSTSLNEEIMLEKFHKWVVLTLVFTLVSTFVQGQTFYNQETSECPSAYMDSCQSAHWSAYVPLTILVVAAIFFGIADKSHSESSSSYSGYTDSGHSRSYDYSRRSDCSSYRGYSHGSCGHFY